MKLLPRIIKGSAHATALVFGAFWLVATSAATGPAQVCFKGIGNPTKLAVVLGTPRADQETTQVGAPSCHGADGLVPGATIIFSLSQGDCPQDVGVGACWGYKTDAFEGATDVTGLTSPEITGQDLTVAYGAYSSSQSEGCRGSWTIPFGPNLPPEGTPISPLDIQSGQGWHVTRDMDIEQAQFCDGAFPGSGPAGCSDWFPVESVTEVSP